MSSFLECFDCQGLGFDPHGNTCIFCDGRGVIDEPDDPPHDYEDPIPEYYDEDELCTPTQEEP